MYRPPHFDRAARRLHNTRKFRQQAIAGLLYGTAPVLVDRRLNEPPEMRFQAFVRPFLVRTHEPTVAGDIRRENGGEPPLHTLFGHSSAPAWCVPRFYGRPFEVSIEAAKSEPAATGTSAGRGVTLT